MQNNFYPELFIPRQLGIDFSSISCGFFSSNNILLHEVKIWINESKTVIKYVPEITTSIIFFEGMVRVFFGFGRPS